MSKRILLHITALVIIQTYSQAQTTESCGTSSAMETFYSNHTQKIPQKDEKWMREWKQSLYQSLTTKRGNEAVYQIPVVFHILFTENEDVTDEHVKNCLRRLNQRLRSPESTRGIDMGVEFVLASRDPEGKCTNGINRINMSNNSVYVQNGIRKNTTKGIKENEVYAFGWDVNTYYNIYCITEIDNSTGSTSGYAYYANAHGFPEDGTYIKMKNIRDLESYVLIHEIGHAFDLRHTFEDGSSSSCPPAETENDCDSKGDYACDTKPHSSKQCGSSNSCVGPGLLSNSVDNYMSYCFVDSLFTLDQKKLFRRSIDTRTIDDGDINRSSYLNETNNAFESSETPMVDFYASAEVVCLGNSIQFYDNSSCIPKSFSEFSTKIRGIEFSWTFSNGDTTIYSSLPNPNIEFRQNGAYDVVLTVKNTTGTFKTTKKGFVHIIPNGPTAACSSHTTSSEGSTQSAIYRVKFGAIDHESPKTNVRYSDLSCTKGTPVTPSNSYPLSISISAGNYSKSFVEGWIDWNDDGQFNGSELVFRGNSEKIDTQVTLSASITIPDTAVLNTALRMRFIGERDAYPTDKQRNCESQYSRADIEDYTLLVVPIPQNITRNISKKISSIFPIPSTGEIELSCSSVISSDEQIIVTNILGKIVHSESGKNQYVTKIRLNVPDGIYFVGIKNGNTISSQTKLLIQN